MTKASDNAFPSLLITEGTEPTAPAAGKQRLYIDSTTHLLKATNSSGTDRTIEASGALGSWTDYTPTWGASTTPPTLGSSTIVGRYKLLDANTLQVQISCVITTGGAWNAGSGGYTFTLPASKQAPNTGRYQVGSAHVLDSGSAHFAGICKVAPNGTAIGEVIIADATASRILGHNIPVTWATGDQINMNITIEVV